MMNPPKKIKRTGNIMDALLKEKELTFQILEILKQLWPKWELREALPFVSTLTDIPLDILENQYMKIAPSPKCETCGDKLDKVDLLREYRICNECLLKKELKP